MSFSYYLSSGQIKIGNNLLGPSMSWSRAVVQLNAVQFEYLPDLPLATFLIDDISISNEKCPLILESCDFESPCTFFNRPDITENKSTDEYLWSTMKGPTTTKQTGPLTDHTTRTEGGTYLYTETSGGTRKEGDTAVIKSRNFIIYEPACFSFWANMNGSHVGKLEVVVNDEILMIIKGDQRRQWFYNDLEINFVNISIEIKIIATRGAGFRGDISIDDILLVNGKC